MEQVTDEKARQSEPADCDTKSIQTEKQGQEKENQTEISNDDKEIQTEVKFYNRANETDINSSNIITVNCTEVVNEMLSWGTQTDLDELESMELIISSEIITHDNIDGNRTKDNLSETESVFSSASKLAEAQMQSSHSKPRDDEVVSVSSLSRQEEEQQPSSSQGVGLDMRRGEYFELDFPPVTTTNIPQHHIDTISKQRTPSPEDLCTHSDVSPARKKKVKISGEKLPAACTISEDPRDVIRYVQKMLKTPINVTPAHQPPHGPGPNLRPEDMSNTSTQVLQQKGTSKVKTTDELQSQKLRHSRRMDSSLAIEALNSDDYYALPPNTGPKIRGNKQFTSLLLLNHPDV